jgi:exopolysaccharide biosynthesis protein
MNLVNSEYVNVDKTVKGKTLPQGHIVSEGKIFQNYATHGRPVGTLIIYKNGKVDIKPVQDISQEKDVWFAVSGLTIAPTVRNKEEGFTGVFSDVLREANRPMIGYNKKTNKIIIAVRKYTTAKRGQLTAKNLGCDKMITLDGGGSTNLRINEKNKFSTSRRIASIIAW